MKKIILLFVVVALTVNLKAQSYVNPLERWATHNLDVLNTFATGDQATSKGKLYQFGRNVPLNAEGSVLYWANFLQTGQTEPPYYKGHPGNWRVWHIHLVNANTDYSTNNWFKDGTTTDTWESIVAQTTALGAPPSEAFPGYEYTVESYTGTNGGSPAPAGWHLPSLAEMRSLVGVEGSNFEYTFNQNNYEEPNIDVLGNGTTTDYTADYKSIGSSELTALRFKGTAYESAYKYEYINTAGEEALKISAKSSGGATIDDIAAWTTEWNDAVVRYFPATGFRAGSNVVNTPTEGYYWSGSVSGTGTAYYLTFSSIRFRISAYNRANAYPIRVIKDCDDSETSTLNKEADKLQIKAVNGKLVVEGLDLAGKYINVFDMQGKIVYGQCSKLNKLEINLPTGLYVVKVDKKKQKVVIK